MSKHTPGPWHAREWTCHAPTSIGIEGGPYGFIQLAECSGLGNHPCVSPEQEEANVRLIVAAPDLLAALKAVVAVADRNTDEFNAARAAIAKAEAKP